MAYISMQAIVSWKRAHMSPGERRGRGNGLRRINGPIRRFSSRAVTC
jgi:hypothetical protein